MPYRYIWTIRLHDLEAEPEFIEHWRKVSSILQSYSGARGSHLHRLEDKKGSFLMIGEWESKEARDAMSLDLHAGKSEKSKSWLTLPPDSTYGEVNLMLATEIEVIKP